MRGWGTGARTLAIGSILALTSQFTGPQAQADQSAQDQRHPAQVHHVSVAHVVRSARTQVKVVSHYYARGGGISSSGILE